MHTLPFHSSGSVGSFSTLLSYYIYCFPPSWSLRLVLALLFPHPHPYVVFSPVCSYPIFDDPFHRSFPMTPKSKRLIRGPSTKQARPKPPATPPWKSPRLQTTLSFVSPAPMTPRVLMDVDDDDEDMTQATLASTTTSTLAASVAAVDAASDAAVAIPHPSPPDGTPAALKTAPPADTTAAASASTRAAILKASNKSIKAGHLWSFAGAGRFSSTPARNTAWKRCPSRLRSNKFAFTHYFSTKEGEDSNSIHDECIRAIPQAFSNSGVSTATSWRSAPQADVLSFVTAVLGPTPPLWLNDKEGSRAHSCMVSLALSWPDAFDSLYAHGNLD
mmetsp:Transcript_3038/g.5365  ORF Transcript_3038/g.5365 Transcript_3038/m.5365 type:complete len:331 (+) Transcript_3038:958-1950(+)